MEKVNLSESITYLFDRRCQNLLILGLIKA